MKKLITTLLCLLALTIAVPHHMQGTFVPMSQVPNKIAFWHKSDINPLVFATDKNWEARQMSMFGLTLGLGFINKITGERAVVAVHMFGHNLPMGILGYIVMGKDGIVKSYWVNIPLLLEEGIVRYSADKTLKNPGVYDAAKRMVLELTKERAIDGKEA